MLTLNLDVTSYQWVGTLAWFNFKLEYQKGHENTMADVLSWVTTSLNPETVKSILDWVALGAVHQSKVHNLAVLESDQHVEQEVYVAAGHLLVEMHVTD